MGKWTLKCLREEGLLNNINIIIADTNEIEGDKLSKDYGVKFTKNIIEASKEADVVIIMVPILKTHETIEKVAPCLKEGALLMDYTSIKSDVVTAMDTHAPKNIEVIGCHPIFGPSSSPTLKGKNVVLVNVRSDIWILKLKKFLEDKKANVIVTSAEEHDRMMGLVQCLTHFIYIIFGSTFDELGYDIKASEGFASPPYLSLLESLARIYAAGFFDRESLKVYTGIQMNNPYAEPIRKKLIENAEKLDKLIKEGKEDEIIDGIIKNSTKFKDLNLYVVRSGDVISARLKFIESLYEKKGKEVCIEKFPKVFNDTSKIHIGTLEDVTPDGIILVEGRIRQKMNLQSIKLLDDKRLKEEKLKRFGKKNPNTGGFEGYIEIFCHLFTKTVNENTINGLIEKLNPYILNTDIVEVYDGDKVQEGFKSITFKVNFPSRMDAEAGRAEIETFLINLGGAVRSIE